MPTGTAKAAINQDSSIIAKMVAGLPLVAVYPSERSVVPPQGRVIGAKSQRMEAVATFIGFVASPEGQAATQDGDDTDFCFIPVIEGVKAKEGG